MATVLKKPVRREVILEDDFGRHGPVVVTLTGTGIVLRGKGTRRELFVPWSRVGHAADKPGNLPGRHAANPIGWLVE